MENVNWHTKATYDSLMTYGLNALKYIMLVNGGAIISLLTFVGHSHNQTTSLKWAFLPFIIGIFLGGLASVTAYVTQLALFNESENPNNTLPSHTIYLQISLILIALGLFAFLTGAGLTVYLIQ
ncbi:MAG: hypothetical protein OXT65_06985 [Alphaproteobacteria bacterium]|nr:hypothetical protein [Alphaproteobacteria bacterium]